MMDYLSNGFYSFFLCSKDVLKNKLLNHFERNEDDKPTAVVWFEPKKDFHQQLRIFDKFGLFTKRIL